MKAVSPKRLISSRIVSAELDALVPGSGHRHRIRPHIYAQQVRHDLAFHFMLAVLAHLLVWTLLPLLFQSNIALDMAEGLAWGKEWQLGYEKDPPLYPWVIQALTTLSGKQLWISYLAGQVCVATVFFSVWQLGKRIASEKEALVGALLLEGIYYFSLPTLEFNDILLQMPFTALFGWLLHKANADNRLRDWIFTGLVASLGLWSRYSMGAIIAPLALFALLHPVSRQRLRTPGPWVMMAVATLMFVPHLIWMAQTDFMSIKYVGKRAPKSPDLLAYLQGLFSFISAQLGALLPMLLVSVLLWRWRSSRDWLQRRWAQFDFAYLSVLALGPVCFSLFLSWVAMRPLRHISEPAYLSPRNP
ncbi:4-amino-4-deoxy-L-arabinose transferase-like glycosyltransferase [Herbaspirillum sp. Sphag1AN]|uniref:glycosyltransferase family 39 protein n=1 Tax=unclassified Herbaspirillum TaxID=2624150 RepID=UPI00161A9C4E|nr:MULTISPECIES: glycosyltransferase family 39 protein [unclassified Herbaspirillum]MBB3213512.1 4-amino-4-deoxy-L-arabinose transferase-like glycosyltransferase [Herbaspirillum sp. Sphag1AN]MBB3246710.1 4-amino-4-deoxy-L-arabinose transferase-like glycosyltransferase [Herbaspirillum sp. Sphag64]